MDHRRFSPAKGVSSIELFYDVMLVYCLGVLTSTCVFVIVPAAAGLDPIAILACDTATVYLALWHEWVLYHSRMKRLESDGE